MTILSERRRRAAAPDDAGMAVVEVIATLPLVIFAGLLTLQAGLLFAGVSQINGAARAAARADGLGLDARAAAEASLPDWLERGLSVTSGAGRVDLTVTVPSVLPGLGPRTVERTVVMPKGR